MANEDHVTRAGYAVASWNRWRDENSDVRPDLSGADLSAGRYPKGKLFEANLEGTDFRRSNMREADLHGSSLKGADLSKTDLRGANLNSANLTGAELGKANLAGANLSGADLTGVDLEKVYLHEANLTGAILRGTRLFQSDLETAVGLDQNQIDQAEGDQSTRLPQGLSRPPSWGLASGQSV